MSAYRSGCTIFLTGAAALLVTVTLASSWKQIHHMLYPEARFWGDWVQRLDRGTRASEPHFVPWWSLLRMEFRRDGELHMFPPLPFIEMETADFLHWCSEASCPRFRVTRSRVMISQIPSEIADRLGDVERGTIAAAYHFDRDGRLVLESQRHVFDGKKTVTLCRFPCDGGECGHGRGGMGVMGAWKVPEDRRTINRR